MKKFISALSLSLLVAMPTLAQTVVGRAAVEGRIVELMSDNTWVYADAAGNSSNCKQLHPRVEFCAERGVWDETQTNSAEIAAQFLHDDRHYGQFIIENLGAADGMNSNIMRQAALGNAAEATGQQIGDMVVLDVLTTEFNGRDVETLVYIVNFDGLNFVFANTFLILDDLTVQAVTFAVGTAYSDKHKDLMQDLLARTTVN